MALAIRILYNLPELFLPLCTGFQNIYEDGKALGFQLNTRLLYYQGVFLSQINPDSLTVNGKAFSKEQII